MFEFSATDKLKADIGLFKASILDKFKSVFNLFCDYDLLVCFFNFNLVV